MTGSSAAAVATIGPIAIPQMRRHGYPDSLSSGAVAAAGTLGMLIPPSVVIVLYGVLSGQSIERLLIAGIVPGIFTAIIYTFVAAWLGRPNALLRATAQEKVLATVGAGYTSTSEFASAPTTKASNDSGAASETSKASGIRDLLDAGSLFFVVEI